MTHLLITLYLKCYHTRERYGKYRACMKGKAVAQLCNQLKEPHGGLLNAVTEYVDHERRTRSAENRMDSVWFGQGAVIKQRALDAALRLAV